MLDLVIPIQRKSAQLDRTVQLIEQHTKDYRLVIVEEPYLNVSEARQKAMDSLTQSRYVCFLDDDSEIVHDGWLDEMLLTMQANPDAGAVFGGEWWGPEARPEIIPVPGDTKVEYGPAACMLLDMDRVRQIRWDNNIGLRSGWMGGDFEEVDYCFRIRRAGFELYRCTKSLFHHVNRPGFVEFGKTDRRKTCAIMKMLLDLKYHRAPEDEDFFKGLKYVPADPNNDLMLGAGASLRDCYHDVIVRNGISHIRGFVKAGLV